MILGIGKTDHLAWLTSFATKAVGLRQHMSEDDTTPITLGDIISTQIETQGGTLISLTHDTTLPRPRSLDFEVQGSLGIWDGVNRRIYLEEMNSENWQDDHAIRKPRMAALGRESPEARQPSQGDGLHHVEMRCR